jgi:hypothetical protein
METRPPLADRIVQRMVDDRPALERLMEQESSRALHEEFLLAESGTLPDREARMRRRRAVGARAWLRHLAGALRAEWDGGPPDLQARLERHVQTAAERLEALELEEEAALEREGYAGDHDADARRVQLGAQMRLFAEGVGEVATPGGEPGPEFGRRVTAVMRRENGRRRGIEKQAFEAWSGSPMEGVLERARTTAAPPEPDVIRMLEAAGVWSYIRVLADALGEVLEGAPQPAGGE